MARIAFIGLGNMGGPMAANLVKAGHEVRGYDPVPAAVETLATAGGVASESIPAAVADSDVVLTMLPDGKAVEAVFHGPDGALAHAAAEALLVDCSTIDVATARSVAAAAAERGLAMLDAPVSGGVAGATAGTLTFMVGGPRAAFAAAEPLFAAMGRTIVHAGDAGAGQAAKICNNMILGVSMIAVCEAFNLADGLGLDRQKLFDIAATASGQCWSLTSYCPVPGPVPASPANRSYAPGFAAAMMLKDLALASDASGAVNVATPLGAAARTLYEEFCEAGGGATDFSGIIAHLRARAA